jgi:transketolase
MEMVRRPHAIAFTRWAASEPRVLVLSADLTSSCEADEFRARYPERFFSLGMAEQNMMSFAGGLAREGFFPFVHTFAVFITRRPFDQVAMSIGYPNLPVRLLGFLPGLTTPGGVTHQAIDDIALMRAIPNMRILECGDATEVESAPAVAQAVDGPVYIRMLRGDVPRLFPADAPLQFGKARLLSPGHSVVVVSSGVCTEEAMRAVTALRKRQLPVGHVHVSTLAPFNDPTLFEAVLGARLGVVVVENHLASGGLGSLVAEVMAEHGGCAPLVRLGLRSYAHGASRGYLMREYGLDAAAIVRAVCKCLRIANEITAQELAHELAPTTVSGPGASDADTNARPEDL